MTGEQLERLAQSLAEVAHDGQLRKGSGEPYIVHPRAVAELVTNYGWRARVAAWLHDVIEDTDVTSDMVRVLFGAAVWADVLFLTRYRDETYRTYVERLVADGSDTALIVKLGDLTHNMADRGWAGAPKTRYIATRAAVVVELERRGVPVPAWAA